MPTLSNTANRYRDLGDLKEARKYYKRAIKIDSTDSTLIYNYERLNRIENLDIIRKDAFYDSLSYHYHIRKYGGIIHEKYE